MSKGNLKTSSNQSVEQVSCEFSCLEWHDGKFGKYEDDACSLAICYKSGRIQLMKNESIESKT
jgi:hypothetical protein